MGKIIGIGMSKTGTTSLHQALTQLGFNSKHHPHREEIFEGDFRWLDRYDAVCDAPVVPYYPQLDEAYPGSKFILTVRDVDEWLESTKQWWKRRNRPPEDTVRMRIAVFGVHTFHGPRLRYVYEKHVHDVKEYFKDRPQDLLTLDICKGEGWEKLCPFVNRPVPDIPFPCIVPGSKKKGIFW